MTCQNNFLTPDKMDQRRTRRAHVARDATTPLGRYARMARRFGSISRARRGRGCGVVTIFSSRFLLTAARSPIPYVSLPPIVSLPYLPLETSLLLSLFAASLSLSLSLSFRNFSAQTGSQNVWNSCRSRFLRRLSGQTGPSARALSQAIPPFLPLFPSSFFFLFFSFSNIPLFDFDGRPICVTTRIVFLRRTTRTCKRSCVHQENKLRSVPLEEDGAVGDERAYRTVQFFDFDSDEITRT